MQFSFISLCVLGIALSAQGLTLEQAMERAKQNHPAFRVLQSDIEAAEGNKTSAEALVNPDLRVGPGMKHTTGPSQSVFHGEVEIAQLIEFPGKRSLRVSLAERNIELRKLARQGFEQQLFIEVERAFLLALATRQIASLRVEQSQSAQTFLQSARKRVEGGFASDFELVKAQADAIATRKNLGDAFREVRMAKLRLAALMGTPSDTAFAVEGSTADLVVSSYAGNPLQEALARNFSIQAQTLRVELAQKNVQVVDLNHKPDLTVSPSLEYTRDEQVYGVNISFPLQVWNRGKGTMQTASAEYRGAQAELEQVKREVSLAVLESEDKVRQSEEQLALYTPEFLDSLKSMMVRAEKVYGQSATTLLIYLETRRSYFESMTDYYLALEQYAESRLDLQAAVGVVFESKSQRNGEK